MSIADLVTTKTANVRSTSAIHTVNACNEYPNNAIKTMNDAAACPKDTHTKRASCLRVVCLMIIRCVLNTHTSTAENTIEQNTHNVNFSELNPRNIADNIDATLERHTSSMNTVLVLTYFLIYLDSGVSIFMVSRSDDRKLMNSFFGKFFS